MMTTRDQHAVEQPSAGEWSGGQLVRVGTCPACGAAQRHLHADDVFDHMAAEAPDRWTVWRCERCASLYLDPRPSDDSLGAAYGAYYTHDVDGETLPTRGLRGWVSSLINGYLNHRHAAHRSPASALGVLLGLVEPWRLKLDYFGAHLFLAPRRPRPRVLDVGAGNGIFMRRALTLGWSASGLDPDGAAVEAARASGLDIYAGFVDSTAIAMAPDFDAVVFRHSIEHVGDIAANLRHALARLRPGGMIWLAWPNPGGHGADFFRESWRGLEVPRHLCIPSAAAMLALLGEAGFERARVLRRGQHARQITGESATIARMRGDALNERRAARAPWIRRWADLVATINATAGEELVVVAYKSGE